MIAMAGYYRYQHGDFSSLGVSPWRGCRSCRSRTRKRQKPDAEARMSRMQPATKKLPAERPGAGPEDAEKHSALPQKAIYLECKVGRAIPS